MSETDTLQSSSDTSDRDPQSPSSQPEPQLSPAQKAALEHLASGTSIIEAARGAGVDRRTVYRWIHADAHFAAAYNAWRQELIDSGRARVLAMGDLALTTVQAAMQKGDARVALQVARATGLLAQPRPGPADPDLLQRRRDLQDQRRDLDLRAKEKETSLRANRIDPDHRWKTDVRELEGHIDWMLGLRQKALAQETPEAREQRLTSEKFYTRHPKTRRLLELTDTSEAAALPAPEQQVSPTEAPAGGAGPQPASASSGSASADPVGKSARPALSTVERAGLSTVERAALNTIDGPPVSAAEPPIRTRVSPIRGVYYDGSDESDNDPQWERIL